MAKSIEQFECQQCGAVFPRWQGQCSACKEWNTLINVVVSKASQKQKQSATSTNEPIPIHQIKTPEQDIISSNFSQVDRLLGEGFVRGSVTLLAGEPGIGKSTLTLQTAQKMAESGQKVLLISGEESVHQIHRRAKRLGPMSECLWLLSETDMTSIQDSLKTLQPDVVILDSIQVVHDPNLSASCGSISQVRQSAQLLIDWIKSHHAVGIIVGHITKEGSIAGPKVLEHMVDLILYLEGERNQKYRILRCYKNRYSRTDEISIFEMKEEGLVEVLQPSELFIDAFSLNNPGSVVAPIAEGQRIFLVEIQALAVTTGFGMAKRNFVGVDSHRVNLLLATLEKVLKFKLGTKDIFLNLIGGLKIKEPALDLAIILAIISSLKETPLREKIGVLGEVGLTGEVRPVPLIEKRVSELQKMGFKMAYLPEKIQGSFHPPDDFKVVYVGHIRDMVAHFLSYEHTKA